LPKEKNKNGEEKDISENGAVYTPSFLVNFLIDECLPLNFEDTSENVKLIDPACGSGIFLVIAYKRLVQRWRLGHKKAGKLADPNPQILKRILKNNIFGIDIHYNSVNLTVFSLQLALCSMLKPRQIWTERGLFNDLVNDGNIIEKDFFDYLAEDSFKRNFDLVIGNPPFKELPMNKFVIYKEKLTKFEEKENINLQIPFYQEALLFLSTSFLLLKKENGKLCLIMKSGPFLYSGDEDNSKNASLFFRSTLFKQYNVTQIIDFTLIKKLFRANVETAAVFIDNKPAEGDSITHIVVRDSRSVSEKSHFELTHYDFNEIPYLVAASTPYIWKCNLLGGAQTYCLVDRLKKFQNLKKYLEKRKTKGWDYGQGYKLGNASKLDAENLIFGKKTIIDKYFNDDGIKKIETQNERNFETIPINSENIFSSPHLMIKKSIGEKCIPMYLQEKGYLTFRNEILGIHCPRQNLNELLNLAEQLKDSNNILRFFIATTSARSGIKRSMYTTDLTDLLNMPLLTKKTFNPSISEQIIIDDVLKYYIDEFGKGKNSDIHKIADKETHIKLFSKVYCDSLNKIYAKGEKRYYFSKLTEGNSFFVCEYIFGKGNKCIYERSDKDLDDLLYSWNPSHSVRYSKIMRIYNDNGNTIRIVKPKKLLYWLQSVALRDSDDTLEDALNRK